MVSVLTAKMCCRSCVEPGRVKPKTLKLVFVASLHKHAALTSNSKNCLVRIMCPSGAKTNMSTSRLLFQLAGTMKIQLSILVLYKVDIIIILSMKFVPAMIWLKNVLFGIKQQSLTHSFLVW